MKHQHQFESVNTIREATQARGLIADLSRIVNIMIVDIASEEEAARVSDLALPEYPIIARTLRARRDNLLAAWREADPQALVIELFPFGRRLMRFELLPLLEAAHAAPRRPVVVSSVRDVLGGGQKDPARQDQMLELFERYFDRLLVHGDPALIRFEQTFGHAARIAHKLHYTGYVVDRAPPAGALGPGGTDEVIVSVGGGAVGRLLLETAMRARPLCALARHTWRFLAGTQVTDTELVELGALARGADGGAAAVEVERNRADFRQLLANCRLSVSQGGYNTIMETLDAGAPSVVVPFAGGAEIEQSLRARLLAERGWIDMVEESDLNPRTLADAIDRAARRSAPKSGVVDLDGARNSAALLARWTSELAW